VQLVKTNASITRVGKVREMRCTNRSNRPSKDNLIWWVVINQANMVLAIKGSVKMTTTDISPNQHFYMPSSKIEIRK
jgi:hypothetical protein